MQRCPICRAALNGADTCRRCRAELAAVKDVARRGQAMLGAAMHSIALGDRDAAAQLLRRARALHATEAVAVLAWGLEAADQEPEGVEDDDMSPSYDNGDEEIADLPLDNGHAAITPVPHETEQAELPEPATSAAATRWQWRLWKKPPA